MLDKDRSPDLSTLLRQPGSLSCWLKVISIVQREFPLLTLTYPGPLILCFHFETVKEVQWLVVLTLIPVQKKPSKELAVGTSLQRTFEYIV